MVEHNAKTKQQLYIGIDIGGTNTKASVFFKDKILQTYSFKTKDITDISENINFIKKNHKGIIAGCMCAAGEVKNNACVLTNSNLKIDLKKVISKTKLKFSLINDMVAAGYGIQYIKTKDILVLNKGTTKINQTKGVISAGTGLGKAIVYSDKKSYIVKQSEGSHSDFPVTDKFEFKLFEHIKKKHNLRNVSYEDIVSGRGLEDIYLFLTGKKSNAEEISKNKDSSATLTLFSKFYARAIKNFILESYAIGGVYITGQIAIKNSWIFKSKQFKEEMYNNTKKHKLLKEVPLYLVKNYDINQLGARHLCKKI